MSHSLRVSRIHFVALIDTVLWRTLAFARSVQARSPLLGTLIRRGVLLLWWTATFQLHIHARYWLRARRLRRAAPAPVELPEPAAVDPETVVVPLSLHPLVSIIVPTYGQVAATLRCLISIAEHMPALPIEVVVVDDAWPGADAASLDRVRGIRLIRNETNLGFLFTCNKAARLCRGEYLLFLNNDTQVLDNWLEPMVALFQGRPDTGAVGAKLLYPDGRLQEAGGIVWQDASGWNFGRLEDPSAPAYNYVREVDYCSGAALMVRRAVFADLGGFDPRYAPAYFEDTDLCFRLRRMGLKTLYQPAARVVHHEGLTHGRDTTVGIKSYQATNRRRFIEAWADVLVREHYPNGTSVFRARERGMRRRVVLVVDHYVPKPDRDAGSRTMLAFLDALLAAGFAVKFWPHNMAYSPGYTDALQQRGVEVFHGPDHPSFDAWIRTNGGQLDAVLLSRPDVAEDVLPAVRRHTACRVVYYGHDLHFRRMAQQAQVTADVRLSLAADAMRNREQAIWRAADLSLYPSREEADVARALQPDAAIDPIVPYGFNEFALPRPPATGSEIVFIAGFGHLPNEDAAIWFITDVLPLIEADVPNAHLSIIGSNPTDRVRQLAGPTVQVHPDVSDHDLTAAYNGARVAVVPLRCGAGVKLKLVEALRWGVPVVTTGVGAQGLPGLDQLVAIHDDARSFADAVVRLLRDDAAWQHSAARQVAYARQHFSRQAMAASLLRAIGFPATNPSAQPDPTATPPDVPAEGVNEAAAGCQMAGLVAG